MSTFQGTETPFDTAGNVVNDAATECGLGASMDPFASADPNFIQLCALLKSTGRNLWMQRQWTHLTKEHLFTTVLGQSLYPLPNGFGQMLSQTGWNRTNRLPLGGPLSPQEWQYLKSRLAGVVFTVLFRPIQQQIQLYPDTNTPGGYDIAFEYVSRYWVEHAPTSPSTGPNASAPTASGDVIWYDAQLATRALKLAFLKAKGFPSEAAENEYQETLQLVMGTDSPGPILSLTPELSPFWEPLLGEQNVPITGFGT